MWPTATYVARSVVCLFVCVGHKGEPCQTGESISQDGHQRKILLSYHNNGKMQFIKLYKIFHGKSMRFQVEYSIEFHAVNKLAPYVTDGRLFASDVSASFKSRDTKTRPNIRPDKVR